MSWQAKGLYRELLDEFWAEGSLPLDHGELADICGCSAEEFEIYWPQISGCWELTEDGLVNAKMDTVRTETDTIRANRARSGSKGGTKENSYTRLQASAKQVLANAKQVQASPDIAEQSRAEHKQSREEKTLASTALAVPAARLVCTLPLIDGTDHSVLETDVQQWQALYLAVDVRQELRNLKGWLLGNPKLRKTKTGIARFINSWLSRSQNEAKPGGASGQRNHGKTAGNLESLERAESFAREQYSQASDDAGGTETGAGFAGDSPDVLDGSFAILPAGH